MVIQASITGMLWESIPTLYFDEECPKEIQLLFTALLGGSVGVVLEYIISEVYRIVFEDEGE